MAVTVRKASIEDVAEAAKLFDLYRSFYSQQPDLTGAETFIAERLQNADSVIFLAFTGGQAIGFVQLYPIFSSVSMQRTWLLNDLYVHQSVRGKGAGTALLNAAKDFAKTTSSKWLMLQTSANNTTAQRLYEKNGWVKESDFFYVLNIQ
ncbi:GNAT family N-acetyltransferase [Foetidibacter luteolus]|uniref:GNAT family N-acetyltransferase n=1 Tax=Foetidibacter luteolus TaxID=2608880 RepID=UPI00129BC53D|nr:GNAT family N-acetyltransferase [Foetidibacter luteolus]